MTYSQRLMIVLISGIGIWLIAIFLVCTVITPSDAMPYDTVVTPSVTPFPSP